MLGSSSGLDDVTLSLEEASWMRFKISWRSWSGVTEKRPKTAREGDDSCRKIPNTTCSVPMKLCPSANASRSADSREPFDSEEKGR